MSDHREIVELIAWYAAGTLDARDRERVDAHVENCGECAGLVDQARRQVELMAKVSGPELTEHVEPGLLTRYVEAPAGLEPETLAWIESRLETCSTCRQAHRRLLEVERNLGEKGEPVAWLAAVWDGMAATLLRPAPALAYLLLLALLVPWLLTREPIPGAAVTTLPVLRLDGERSVRDDTQPVAPPARLPGSGHVLVMLETDLAPEDLERLGFAVEIERDGETILSRTIERRDFETRPDGRIVLPLLLDADRWAAGVDHEIKILAVRPGDPLDGQALFRRMVRRDAAGGDR